MALKRVHARKIVGTPAMEKMKYRIRGGRVRFMHGAIVAFGSARV